MRLQSKFKDYYDFVGHIHRDEHPRAHVWERKTKVVEESERYNAWAPPGHVAVKLLLPYIKFVWYQTLDGKLRSFEPGYPPYNRYKYGSKDAWEGLLPINQKEVDLQEKHGTPLILIDKDITINPNLKKLKLTKVIDPYELHQKIDQWFSDGRFSNDPPQELTDKQKIASHGFDVKRSFRH